MFNNDFVGKFSNDSVLLHNSENWKAFSEVMNLSKA